MWSALQIIFIALGLLLAYIGMQSSIPILLHAGVGCLGLGMIAMGWEGMITQRMVLGGRRRPRQTYTGIPAILQGIQFNFIGLFLIGMAFMMQFDNAEEVGLQLVRRPGLPLVLLGGLCLLQAMILFFGSQQAREGSGGLAILGLLFSRLLPGLILVIIGVGLGVLGLFDTLAPARFDEMGGALLEEVYGGR